MQHYLPTSYLLQNRYLISRKIGQGGFGITYLALDTELNKKVCIKELYIDGVNIRQGDSVTLTESKRDFPWTYFIDNFKKEAQKIAEFRHPNIVSVSSVFEANGTAYYVMEFIEGETLKARIQQMGRAFTAEELKPIINQLFDAVDELHNKGLLHRDLKPDNIMIDKNDWIILIDFGSARENMDEKTATLISNTTLIFLTHGYAAPEMYSTSVIKGRYTDIYSLGATLYNLLTNQKPVVVNDRHLGVYLPAPHELNPQISGQLSSAIMLAMELKKEERFQNIADFRVALTMQPKNKPTVTKKNNAELIISGIALALILVVLLISQPWKADVEVKLAVDTADSTKTERAEEKEVSNQTYDTLITQNINQAETERLKKDAEEVKKAEEISKNEIQKKETEKSKKEDASKKKDEIEKNKLIIKMSGQNLEVYSRDLTKMNWYDAQNACKKLGAGWRLPTEEELEEIYLQLHKLGEGEFKLANYWSSTEYDNDTAWGFNFNTGDASSGYKSNKFFMRAVRAL
jgi:serine/threonine protein kinase